MLLRLSTTLCPPATAERVIAPVQDLHVVILATVFQLLHSGVSAAHRLLGHHLLAAPKHYQTIILLLVASRAGIIMELAIHAKGNTLYYSMVV